MQNRELKFIIRVQNEARAALARLRGQLGDIGKGGDEAARGSRRAARGQRDLQENAKRTTQTLTQQNGLLKTLTGSLKALAGVYLIGEAVRLSDAYQSINNKLKVVTGTTAEATYVYGQLKNMAMETYQSLDATVTVYQRTAQAQKALGINTETVLRFTENLNKAVLVSGATSQEASAALMQLGQGLGSGVLQGEELRSVLEQLPYVARIIAKEVGVETPGALKKLAAEGKVTSIDIVNAMNNAEGEINEAVGKIAPTIGQAMENVKTALTDAWGEFTTGTGLASGLAIALKFVADNFKAIASAAIAAAAAYASFKALQGIGVIVSSVRSGIGALVGYAAAAKRAAREQTRLNMALGAGSKSSAVFATGLKGLQVAARATGRAIMAIPIIGWAAAAITALIALVQLTAGMKVNKDSASTMGDVYGVAFQKLANEAKAGVKKAMGAISDMLGMDFDFENMDFREMFLSFAAMVDDMSGKLEQFIVWVPAKLDQLQAQAETYFIGIYNDIVEGWINPALAAVTNFINNVIAAHAALFAGVKTALSGIPDLFMTIFQNALSAVAQLIDKAVNGFISILNALPGVEIDVKSNISGLVGPMQEVPDILGDAAAAGRKAFNENLGTFEAPELDKMEVGIERQMDALGLTMAGQLDEAYRRGVEASNMQNWWTDVFDEAEQQAKDRAEAAAAAAKAAGEDVEQPDKPGDPDADKKIKKVKDAIAALMKELFPARARMKEFYEKMDLLSKVNLNAEDKAAAIQTLREAYGDLSGPVAKFTKDLEDQIKLAGLAGDAHEDMALRIDLETRALEDNGGVMDDATRAAIDNAVAKDRARRMTERFTEAQQDLNRTLRAMKLDTELLKGGYTDDELERMREIETYRLELMEAQGLAGKSLAEMNQTELEHYYKINQQVDQYAAAVRAADQAERERQGNAMAGLRNGIEQWRQQAANVYQQMGDLASQTLDGMTNVVTEFVTTGKASFGDFARSVIASIVQIMIKMLLLKAISSFLGPLGGGIGGGLGGGGGILGGIIGNTGFASAKAGIKHTGGMAGAPGRTRNVPMALFAHAQRKHSGGMAGAAHRAVKHLLKPGEVPIIALENERILNPEETRAYNAGQAASGMASSGNGLQGGGSQVVLAPQFNNSFDLGGNGGGMDEQQAADANKALERDAKAFMEKWVQNEMRPGGRLAPRR